MLAAPLFLVIAGAGVLAAQDAKPAILALYSDTLRTLRAVQSKDDIARMVDAIDVPEWTSSLPNGQTMTRPQATRELEALLAVPNEGRPEFRIHPIHWMETPASVTVLYWVYMQTGSGTAGSIARDAWARTAAGWRRIRHEKLMPDRPLISDGKPVFAPPLPEKISR